MLPGQQVDIEVELLNSDSTGGDVEVVWYKMPEEERLDTLISRAPSKSFVGTTKTVTIPASPARNEPYALVVNQYFANEPTKRLNSAATMLYVLPPRQQPQPQPQPKPQAGPDAELTRANTPGAATVTRPDGTRAPAGTPAPGVNAPAGSNGPAVVAGAPAPSQTDSALSPQPASVATEQGIATFGQPGTSPASPAVTGEPARSASPRVADLWSGLDADKAPSLLDTPVTTSDSRAPMGGILLGAGVIALAGVALAATRRRLAVVTRR